MSKLAQDEKSKMGLRERKKAKTKAAIQQHALRLFREQGYHATTVEQIAEAAEISTGTFFRYFPNKEDVVLSDVYDPLLAEAVAAQPDDLGPISCFRNAMRQVFTGLPATELEAFRERSQLVLSVPELRAASWNNVLEPVQMVTQFVAQRVGRSPDDLAVRNFAFALLGVQLSAFSYWIENPHADLITVLDDALVHLEAGLPL